MSETLGRSVVIVLHENGERVGMGYSVINIEEKAGGVRIIHEEHSNIPTFVSPEDKIEVKD